MGKNRIPADILRDAIIYFIKERHISIPSILQVVDISRSRLYDYLQGNGKVSATTLTNILIAIGVTFDELLIHIFLTHPESIDTTIKDFSLASESRLALPPDEDTVYRVLSVYEETNNTNLLVQLVRTINSRITDEEDSQNLIHLVYPTIYRILKKREFFTSNDTLLFANIMRQVPYEEAKVVANRIRKHADLINTLEGYGDQAVRSNLHEEIRNYALIHYNLLIMALDNNDTEIVTNILDYFKNYDLMISDFYFSVTRKLAQVIELILAENREQAKKLWQIIINNIHFFIEDEFQLLYQYLTRKTFEEFAMPVDVYMANTMLL